MVGMNVFVSLVRRVLEREVAPPGCPNCGEPLVRIGGMYWLDDTWEWDAHRGRYRKALTYKTVKAPPYCTRCGEPVGAKLLERLVLDGGLAV